MKVGVNLLNFGPGVSPDSLALAEALGYHLVMISDHVAIFKITDSSADDADRVAGQGTVDQIRGDLEGLEALGARVPPGRH